MSYETQGFYLQREIGHNGAYLPASGKRIWQTHIDGLTLAEALDCYRWFKYGMFKARRNDDCPTDARIVNTETGEVMPPPDDMQEPVKRPGHGIATIIVTEQQWGASYPVPRDAYDFVRVTKRKGREVYAFGSGGTFGYIEDGVYYLSPYEFRNAK
jgi:hypothetical protein